MATSPITVECPACYSKAGEPCTRPTDTGRANVRWFHMTREALADITNNYVTRVLWEGNVLESTEHGDQHHIAEAHYSNTVDKYRRQDPIEGGVTVQLIDTSCDDVLYEEFIDGANVGETSPTEGTAWADGFGVWHASVPLSGSTQKDALAARRLILAALKEREGQGFSPKRVRVTREHVSNHGTVTYREV